jgi:hypothetical protein
MPTHSTLTLHTHMQHAHTHVHKYACTHLNTHTHNYTHAHLISSLACGHDLLILRGRIVSSMQAVILRLLLFAQRGLWACVCVVYVCVCMCVCVCVGGCKCVRV